MEYQNIIIFGLIFIVFMTIFYLIINNFGISNYRNDIMNNNNINELEKKVLMMNNELLIMKKNNYISNISNKLNESNISNLSNKSNETNQSNMTNDYNDYNDENNKQKNIKEIIIETEKPIINLNENKTNNQMNSNFNSKPPPIIYDPIANYDIAKLTDPLVDPRGRSSADQIPTPQVAAQFNFPTQGILDKYHRVGLLIANDSNKHIQSNNENVWEGQIKKNKPKKIRRTFSPETEKESYKGIDIKENFDSDSNYENDIDSIEEFTTKSNKKVITVYNNYLNQDDNNILELIGKKITDNWYKYFTSITVGNKIIKVVIRNNNRRELYSGDQIFVPEIGKSFRVKIDPMDMIEYNPYMF
jgi:hypothetical protein